MVPETVTFPSEPVAVSTSGPKPTWQARDGPPFVEIFNQQVRKETPDKTTRIPDPDRPHSQDNIPVNEKPAVESHPIYPKGNGQEPAADQLPEDEQLPTIGNPSMDENQPAVIVDAQAAIIQSLMVGLTTPATVKAPTIPQQVSQDGQTEAVGNTLSIAPNAEGQGLAAGFQAIADQLMAGGQVKAVQNRAPVVKIDLQPNQPEVDLHAQAPVKFLQLLATSQPQAENQTEAMKDQAAVVGQPPINANSPKAEQRPVTLPLDGAGKDVVQKAEAAVEQIIADRAASQPSVLPSTLKQVSEPRRSLHIPQLEQGPVDGVEQPVVVKAEQSVAVKAEQSVAVKDEQSVAVKAEQSVPVKAEQSVPVKAEQSVPVKAEQSVAVKAEQSVPVKAEQSVPVKAEQSVPVKAEQSVPVKAEQSVPVKAEQSVPVKAEQSVPVKAEQTDFAQATLAERPAIRMVNAHEAAASAQKVVSAKDSAEQGVQPSVNKANTGVELADVGKAMGAPPGINNSEPARLAEARSPHLTQQIARQLEYMADSGLKTLRMQLYPEALGKLELQLTSQGGSLKVVILADQAATQQMLERHAQDLQQVLQQTGVNLTGLTIGQRGVGDQSGREQQQALNSPAHKLSLKDQPDEEISPEEATLKVTRPGIYPSSASSLEYWI